MSIKFLRSAAIQKKTETLAGSDLEVVSTFRADVKGNFQLLFPDKVIAVGTLGEEPFSLDPPFFFSRSVDRRFGPFKPRHLTIIVEKGAKKQLLERTYQ